MLNQNVDFFGFLCDFFAFLGDSVGFLCLLNFLNFISPKLLTVFLRICRRARRTNQEARSKPNAELICHPVMNTEGIHSLKT